MSKLGWFAIGIAIGAAVVTQVRDNPKAQQAIDDALASAQDFGAAVAEGFREREAELSKSKTRKASGKTA
jgi:hypothetical protein